MVRKNIETGVTGTYIVRKNIGTGVTSTEMVRKNIENRSDRQLKGQ